jgi:hypothetical protein
MAKKLTYTCYVGGKPVDKLTPEQLDSMADRIGKAMSIYYAAHTEEYRALLAADKEPKSGAGATGVV